MNDGAPPDVKGPPRLAVLEQEVGETLGELTSASTRYRELKDFLNRLDADPASLLSVHPISLVLQIGMDLRITVPPPEDPEKLKEYVTLAQDELSNAVVASWERLHELTTQAVAHCQAARAAAEQAAAGG